MELFVHYALVVNHPWTTSFSWIPMSLLREAQRCLANQAARKSLNAFITLPDTAAVLRQVQDAESRSSQRKSHHSTMHSPRQLIF